jgi:hypothetical protein
MPTQKSKLTKTEDQENRTILSQLEGMGILTGRTGNLSPEPDGLTFEQTQNEFATIYELPWGEVAVVVPAMMTILTSRSFITAAAMLTPWDERPLDLWDPEEDPNYEENAYYKDLINWLPYSPPTVLNRLLTNDAPLRPHRVKGVIFAHGYSSIPSKFHDHSLVMVELVVELLLRDERRKELSFDFGVRMDRSLIRKYERRQRERREFAPSTKGGGLYEPKRGHPAVECFAGGSIKQPYANGEHDVTYDARTPETKLRDR